jgi:hypothetical protein
MTDEAWNELGQRMLGCHPPPDRMAFRLTSAAPARKFVECRLLRNPEDGTVALGIGEHRGFGDDDYDGEGIFSRASRAGRRAWYWAAQQIGLA